MVSLFVDVYIDFISWVQDESGRKGYLSIYSGGLNLQTHRFRILAQKLGHHRQKIGLLMRFQKKNRQTMSREVTPIPTQMVQPPRPHHLEKRMDQERRRTASGTPQRTWQQVDRHRRQDDRKVLYPQFRSDNSIKNYFYSTVRRNLRRMGKLLGSKNSTGLMR